MLQYALRNEEMNRVFRLLRDLLDVRITFFDVNNREADQLDAKEMCAFCRSGRRDAAFDARCRACDLAHLQQARAKREPVIYRCHANLMEGVVPLFDPQGVYLGSWLFGQLRPAGGKYRGSGLRLRRLYSEAPAGTPHRMMRIAWLLQCLSEHVIARELVRLRESGSMERLIHYIDAHPGERLTLRRLAEVVGRSSSYIAHHFRQEHGVSLMRFVRNRRLEQAAPLVAKGMALRAVAERYGFCDEFHFSRAYRRHFGKSPGKARLSPEAKPPAVPELRSWAGLSAAVASNGEPPKA